MEEMEKRSDRHIHDLVAHADCFKIPILRGFRGRSPVRGIAGVTAKETQAGSGRNNAPAASGARGQGHPHR